MTNPADKCRMRERFRCHPGMASGGTKPICFAIRKETTNPFESWTIVKSSQFGIKVGLAKLFQQRGHLAEALALVRRNAVPGSNAASLCRWEPFWGLVSGRFERVFVHAATLHDNERADKPDHAANLLREAAGNRTLQVVTDRVELDCGVGACPSLKKAGKCHDPPIAQGQDGGIPAAMRHACGE